MSSSILTCLSLIPVSQLLIFYPWSLQWPLHCPVQQGLHLWWEHPKTLSVALWLTGLSGRSLLLPEARLGLTSDLKWDLWSVFRFSLNISYSHSGHGLAAIPLPTSGATGLEGRAAQNLLQMEARHTALMDVSGTACPYSSPTDPCKAGCSKCCPAGQKWHHSSSLSPTLPAWSKGTKELYVNYGGLPAHAGGAVCSGMSGSGSGHHLPAASNWTGAQHELQETSSILSTQMSHTGAKKREVIPYLFFSSFYRDFHTPRHLLTG